jgi:glucose/arabinose dehydrogenase
VTRTWYRVGPGLVAALAGLVLVAACGSGGGSSPGATPATTTSSTAPIGTTTTTPAVPDLAAVRFRLTKIADLEQPVALAARPGHPELYVAEKTGRVRVLDGNAAPLVDIHSEVSTGNEQGLLGLAFSPDGAYLYLSYTDTKGDTRLDEWAVGAGARDLVAGSRRNVLAVDQPAPNHNGGTILFGPDGHLWFGLGDGGGEGDPFGNGQNTGSLLGTMLRIDPRPAGSAAYSSPADNPYAAGGGRPEIAVIGVRNPWKFSFDRATGDLWIGDVGQDRYEEIDRLPAGHLLGANLGWPFMEATHPYKGTAPAGLVGPVQEYSHQVGQAVVGGYVYRGSANPSMVGAYLFADTYKGNIQLLTVSQAGRSSRDSGVAVPGGMPVSFGQDDAGELYVLSLSGGVFRLDPA